MMLRKSILAITSALLIAIAITPAANADTYWETVQEFRTGVDPDGA